MHAAFRFLLLVFSLLAFALPALAGKNPDITSHSGQYLERSLHVQVRWHSLEPVVQVQVTAGQFSKEIKVDEYDNRRTSSGYDGEVTVNIPVDAALFQKDIPYIVQIRDELGRKSALKHGKAPLPASGFDGGHRDHRGDGWGREHLQGGPPKAAGADIMDKLLATQERHDIAPTMDAVQANVTGMNVTFSSRANDDKGLRELVFKLYDGKGALLKTETLSGLGKVWSGSSPVFALPAGGAYRVTGQAFDTAGNSSKEQATTFNAGVAAPPSVDGICGEASRNKHTNLPMAELCSEGIASSISGVGPWAWTCAGKNGGATVSCTAEKMVVSHKVTASGSDVNGTITPATQQVVSGGTAKVSLKVNQGYKANLNGCGLTRTSVDTGEFPTGPVTGDCEIKATFILSSCQTGQVLKDGKCVPMEYKVTASGSDINGTITPATQQVVSGGTAKVSLKVNQGYKANLNGCGLTRTSVDTGEFPTGPVTGDCEIKATFILSSCQTGQVLKDGKCVPMEYKVTASGSDINGTITPATQQVVSGGTAKVSLKVNQGYKANLNGCGLTRTSVDTGEFPTGPVTGDCEIKATFILSSCQTGQVLKDGKCVPMEYKVTASGSDINGTITPATQQVVSGGTAKVSLKVNQGYKANLNGCGLTRTSVDTGEFPTGPVTGDCEIKATFILSSCQTGQVLKNGICVPVKYPVKATVVPANSGIATVVSGSDVEHDKKATITAVPADGYELNSITGCGGGNRNGNNYTTAPVTAPCDVRVEFSKKPEIMTIIQPQDAVAAGAQWRMDNGQWLNSGEKQSVSEGTYTVHYKDVTCWTLPKPEQVVVKVPGTTLNVVGRYDRRNYKLNTAVSGTGGTLTAQTPSVACGSPGTVNLTAQQGYKANLNGCGINLSAVGSGTYATQPLNADCTVQASFVADTYTVTASGSSAGNTISLANQSVQANKQASYSIALQPNYKAEINGTAACAMQPRTVTSNGTYQTGAINSNGCEVKAVFGKIDAVPPTATIKSNKASYEFGETATITITAADNEKIKDVKLAYAAPWVSGLQEQNLATNHNATTFSATRTLVCSKPGTVKLAAQANDMAGNVMSSSVQTSFECKEGNLTCSYSVPGECSSSGVAIWRSSDISNRTVSASNSRAQLNFVIENGGQYTWSGYKFMIRSVDGNVCLDKNNGSLQPTFSATGGGGSTNTKLDIDVPKVKGSYYVVLDIIDTKQNCRLKSPAKTVNGRSITGPIGFNLVAN